MSERVWEALSTADPVLVEALRGLGRLPPDRKREGTPFGLLAEAIVYQQVSTKAAATVMGRLRETVNGEWSPQAVLGLDPERLRGAGLTRAKTAALLDLAGRVLDGTVPEWDRLETMPDEEVVRRLTAVRGVGVWTAQMFLIFSLKRPDVMPAADLGIRRGFQNLFRRDGMPSPAEVLERSERWRPHRTLVSLYLWHAARTSSLPSETSATEVRVPLQADERGTGEEPSTGFFR